jgi:hypothetical protein
MKRSEIIEVIRKVIYEEDGSYTNCHPDEVLKAIEDAGMLPKKYIHPIAREEFGDIIKQKGEHWGYIHFIDKYPEHHFRRGRPYEYYLSGWEPENEEN